MRINCNKMNSCRNFFCFLVALFYAGNIYSQGILSEVQQSLNHYREHNYKEKVFLHVDKNVFATGEILWFKAYVTDGRTNRFSTLSKICYVEIITNESRSLMQGKIEIDSGRGCGSFTIPSSLATGNYLVRAYTNWMKNFSPDLYFEQQISIINPRNKPSHHEPDSLRYSLRFFPEGGNLVNGLNSTVAFKMTDQYGKVAQGQGVIINSRNDTIAGFSADHSGQGQFNFTPEAGNNYRVSATIGKAAHNFKFPDASESGWTLHLENAGDNVQVKVAGNVESQQKVYLLAQSKDSVSIAMVQILRDNVATFMLSKSRLAKGISRITLFNENKQPVCERLYFKKPSQMERVSITPSSNEFQQRKKVTIDLSLENSGSLVIEADLSASVYLVDSIESRPNKNIEDYLWLSSEIQGNMESPLSFSTMTENYNDEIIDNMLLTEGWSRYNWEEIFSKKEPAFSFLPEQEGHIITGKFYPLTGNLPDTGMKFYLSVPGNDFRFVNGNTIGHRAFRFNVGEFFGRHDIILQPGEADSSYRLSIDNPFSEKFSKTILPPIVLDPAFARLILTRTIAAQSSTIFQPGINALYKLPSSYDSIAFFGLPSKTYLLDDYTRFTAMEEVMREYVKEVRVRKKQEQFHYEVYNQVTKLFFDNEPLVLIDGVPVFNINHVMNVDPLKVKKIDLMTTKIFQGNEEYDGIVSYSTYAGDLGGYELDPASLVVDYDGLQLEREFYLPQYETVQQKTSRLPDFRNVLYWSPNLQTRNEKTAFSFYTSDIPGKYKIVVQGLSLEGAPVIGYSEILVR